jgi:OOP family OmpA-OmpF porin
MKLSQDRANRVKAYLISKGVTASRLDAKGYGPSRPISTGTTEAEKAKNRRVELKLSNQ